MFSPPEDDRIFVLIPSYRDPECHHTINDLFAKAVNPERIFVGVCWQYDKQADAEMLKVPLTRPEQVQTVHYRLEECLGAGWARNEALKLANGEPYLLQIQAHHRFEHGWDQELIAMLSRCPSDKPAITGWLPGYVPPDARNLPKGRTTRYFYQHCDVKNDPQMLHMMYRVVDESAIALPGPQPAPSWVGNFLFARSEILREVPFDPEIYFWGEEIDFSARAWTHGWDFFQFDRTVAYHYWDRDQKGANEYRDFQNPRNVKTRKRLHHLFGLNETNDKEALRDLSKYGLGEARTLGEYWDFAGLAMPEGKILPKARRGVWPAFSRPAEEPRIFVQIASYRDPECQRTVRSLFEKAANPERIFVGVCLQQEAGDPAPEFTRPEQVRAMNVRAADSQGAGWARSQCGLLRRGEEYTLLVDSHMRFEPGWDETLLSAITRAPSQKPVITAYCSGYRPGTDKTDRPARWRIRVNALGGRQDPQMVHLTGVVADENDARGDLYPSPFCIFHFIFAKSETFDEVPVDPHIMFWGDELTHAARLWTHGYDIFQPDRSLAYHLWERGEEQKTLPYRPLANPKNRRSGNRVRHLLGLQRSDNRNVTQELELYGLGTARTLESFFKFAGIDFSTRSVRPASLKGYWFHTPEPHSGTGKIFVSIASYRDPECQHTVKDLFEKAAHPENIVVGICWQYDPEKDAHCFENPYPRPQQVRVAAVDWQHTQGVCWARWQIQNLWHGEEYYLQIDSHSRFVEGWDEKLIAELAACPSNKPVLSGCIARYTPLGGPEPEPKASVLRAGVFAPDGNIRNRGAFLTEFPPKPLNGAFVSGGFIFARSQMVREVPYDPYLSFDQEEMVFSARLYTHGWDVFSSRHPFIYHYYIKPDEPVRPSFGQDMRSEPALEQRYEFLRSRGLKRMDHLLGHKKSDDTEVLRDLGPFGIEGTRSLAAFENYCGIDFKGKRVSDYALRGRFIEGLEKYVSAVHVPEVDDNIAPVAEIMSEEERLSRLKRQPAATQGPQAKTGQIFVQIASYRDPQCQHTVKDLFEKAAHPERIFVGICWLADAEEDAHCFEVEPPRPEQVRSKRYHYSQSRGVSWARSEAQSLSQDEEYTLQIDSHMRFEQGWDDALVEMLERLPAPKAAITAVLPGYEPIQPMVTRMQVKGISPQLAVALAAGEADEERQGLYPTPFLSGSFLFARTQLFEDVPPDPSLAIGGSVTQSARLWTHGYLLYQPDRPVAYHRLGGLQAIAQPAAEESRVRQSLVRAKHLLGMEFSEDEAALADLDRYGHGNERSIESYWEFAGVDPEGLAVAYSAAKGEWGMQSAQPGQLPRIFVQIASYRDPECQYTVKELFESAAHPERIFVGIIWQYIKEEDQYCFAVPCPRPEQVRIIHVDAREGKGVCWARSQVQELWQGEEYTLQIDSHMRFEHGWDDMLIEQLKACPNPRSVLSTYPAGYTPPRDIEHRITYRLVAKEFDQDGVFTMGSRPIAQNPPPAAPVLGAFVGACMLFGPGSIIRDVPYDPKLYFFGEEISLSMRLWTQGYDIYHPSKPIMYHFWERKARRTHFDDHQQWPRLNKLSCARVRHLLGCAISTDPEVLAELEHYGVGKARTLEQYQKFCGVDFSKHDISQAALDGWFPADKPRPQNAKPPQQQMQQRAQQGRGPQQMPKAPQHQQAQQRPAAAGQSHAHGNGNGNGMKHIVRNNAPRKVLETPDCIVYDDFLPQDVYDRLFDFVSQTDYQYINTQGKVKRVWDMTNGFPLRSEKNVFYYAPGTQKPQANWVYPSKTPFDRFVEHVNPMVPNVQHLVGAPGKWEHFSVTSWIYPPGTGLSMHDDGSGVYTGAYVFFMNDRWRAHWGGLLIVLDHESNQAIQQRKNDGNAYKFHMQKWLHITEHDDIAMERGLAQCIFPKANRIVFIHPEAFHMVTQVSPVAGDRVRMSLAGFFHRGKLNQQGAQAAGNNPPETY